MNRNLLLSSSFYQEVVKMMYTRAADSLLVAFAFARLSSVDQPVRSLRAACHVHQLHLDEQWKVIAGYSWVWATDHFVLAQPVRRERSQQSQRYHALLRVKNVVDNTFEVECEIGVGHDIFAVGGCELEGMGEFIGRFTIGDFLQA